jgi:hypothetical protein
MSLDLQLEDQEDADGSILMLLNIQIKLMDINQLTLQSLTFLVELKNLV